MKKSADRGNGLGATLAECRCLTWRSGDLERVLQGGQCAILAYADLDLRCACFSLSLNILFEYLNLFFIWRFIFHVSFYLESEYC